LRRSPIGSDLGRWTGCRSAVGDERQELTSAPALAGRTCAGAGRRESLDRNTIRGMAGLTPYFHFQGTAREALSFYAGVFGGATQLHTFSEFGRSDGPADAIAHGYLTDTPVALFASDVAAEEPAFHAQGLMLSLLGTAEPDTLRRWFAALAEGGQVVDDLQERPWGASDGQVIDRYGLHWLIGFEREANG
jgi:PhnB protein